MSVRCHQISLKEAFAQCQDLLMEDTPSFFKILDDYVVLDDFIPPGFSSAFYKHLGRNRLYPLSGFLSALILQKIFSIPTDAMLILFLGLCQELRDFCGFSKVPDASLFTRFKQDFLPYIEQMFSNMVDVTEPICQAMDASLAQTLIFDTSGIELYVAENNPKNLNALIRRLKSFYKNRPDVDPYRMAYGLMPAQAAACPHAKQMYINGHFCYADKFAVLTNGLGVVRHIAFLDDPDFHASHPALTSDRKVGSPERDKSLGDSSALQPVLKDFFSCHPDCHPSIFLGDAAFDSAASYGLLLHDFHFSKALIPYNPRNKGSLKKVGYNEYGYPTCPNDPSLTMKYLGITREKGRADRIKWGCPRMHYDHGWICDCETPCTTAKCGRTAYTYDNMDLRMFPGIQRDSDQWVALYKVRASIERTIAHFKTNLCVAGRKSRNHLTTKADVFLAGIASLLTVIVASRMNCPQFLRSLKPLIA